MGRRMRNLLLHSRRSRKEGECEHDWKQTDVEVVEPSPSQSPVLVTGKGATVLLPPESATWERLLITLECTKCGETRKKDGGFA